MLQIGIRELRQHTAAIVRRVRQGQEVLITYRGRPVARILPLKEKETASFEAVWAEMDKLAAEVSALWQGESSAQAAVEDVRREL